MRLLLILLVFPFSLAAQNKTSGYLIYTLGTDTTQAGRFQLNGNNEFEIEVVSRPPISINKMTGKITASGEIEYAEGQSFKPGENGENILQTSYKYYINGDSSFIEATPAGKTAAVSRFKGKGHVVNGIGPAFRYFLPFWVFSAPQKTGDSINSCHFVFNSCRPFVIKRIASDKLYAGSGVMGMVTLNLDKSKQLRSINAIGSSWNVNGTVVASFDLAGFTRRAVEQQKSGTASNTLNVLDSAQANVEGANIKIVYSRPKMRGRKIFGEVVPYNRFWRTGANAATRLITDKAIRIGDKELPAGAYSIWTLPSEKGWTMMINSKPNIWGTEYNPENDLLRVPLRVETITQPVELMSIAIQSIAGVSAIVISWENTKAILDFNVVE